MSHEETTVVGGKIYHVQELSDTERSTERNSDTLVLYFGFTAATPKAMSKYAEVYTSCGYDVIVIPFRVRYWLWIRSLDNYSRLILNRLKTTMFRYEKIIIHAMSAGIGGSLEVCWRLHEHPELYDAVRGKFCAYILDSPIHPKARRIAQGVGKFAKSRQAEVALILLTYIWLLVTWPFSLGGMKKRQYKSTERFPLSTPILIFACKNDPMMDVLQLEKEMMSWRQNCSIELKLWDDSVHVRHYAVHREEYLDTLHNFLFKIDGINKETRVTKL